MTQQGTNPSYWADDPAVILKANPDGGFLPSKTQNKVVFENSIARLITILSVGAAFVEKKLWPLAVGGGLLTYRYTQNDPKTAVPLSTTAVSPVSMNDIPTIGAARNPTAQQPLGQNPTTNSEYEPHTQPRMIPRGITSFQDALTMRGVDTTHTYGNMGGEIDNIFEKPSRRAQVMEKGWGEYGWRRNPLECIDWEHDLTRAPDGQRELMYQPPGAGMLNEH